MGFEIHSGFLVGSIIILSATYVFAMPDGSSLIPKWVNNVLLSRFYNNNLV